MGSPLLASATSRLLHPAFRIVLILSFLLVLEKTLGQGALPDGLSQREAEVIGLVASGRTNKEIADTLVLSVTTVQRHIAKIDVRGRADATAYAIHQELVGTGRA